MVEFTGFGPISGVRVAHDLAPLPKAQPPNVVPAAAGADRVSADLPDQRGAANSGAQGGGAQTGTQARGRTGAQAASVEGEGAAKTGTPLREDALTGPPPAFDTTPLDVETDLRLTLARLNAAGYGQDPATQAEVSRSAPVGQQAQTGVATPAGDKEKPAPAKRPEETQAEPSERVPEAARDSTGDAA